MKNKKPAKTANKKTPPSKKFLLSRQKKIKETVKKKTPTTNIANQHNKEKALRKINYRLRRRAEEMTGKMAANSKKQGAMSPTQTRRTLHELSVHQIELEMQNEELQRAQSELEAAQSRYFDLYDLAPVGYCTVNEKGLITEANLTTSTLLGVARGKLVKQLLTRFIFKEDQDVYYLHRKKLFDTGEPQTRDVRMIKKDGTVFWAHLAAIVGDDKNGTKLCRVVMSDITERKQAEQSLHESEQKFRTLTESSPTAILLYQNNKWVYANPATTEITGYTDQELRGMNFWDIVHPDDKQLVQERGQKRQKGEAVPNRYIFRIISKDGNVKWVDLSGATIVIGGSPAGIITVLDITERKRAEDELKKYREHLEELVRERTAELEAFSYSVSHDLRAPLRTIDGFGLALLEDYEDKLDTQAKNYLKRLRTATGTMAELIEDMLKLFRITRTEMDVIKVNLSNIVHSIMDELRKSQPQRIVNIKIADSLEDSADPRLIRIVLENLLGNAWKFTEKEVKAEIEFGLTQKDNMKVYFIHDNGAGFDMEYAGKLFAPFQRLHNVEEYPGTGIGLAIVNRIIHRHGGKVWAEGTPGHGATFYFTLQ